ncbi:MAG: hypothetical protein E7162_03970 [Firmicutes bacterium]|nr:hypothetical protein [Bacillota bacterium]
MANLNGIEKIIKEKSEFIEKNAIKLYNMRGSRGFCDSSTIEEALVSILLSDKPLTKCSKYEALNGILTSLDDETFPHRENENYPLKVIFSVTRYINSVTYGEEQLNLRNKIRRYIKYINNRTFINSEIKIDDQEVEKILQKK